MYFEKLKVGGKNKITFINKKILFLFYLIKGIHTYVCTYIDIYSIF